MSRSTVTLLAFVAFGATSVIGGEHTMSALSAEPFFTFTRSLQGRGYPFDGDRPINSLGDYNGDGIQELVIGEATYSNSEVAIFDGLTGTILKRFQGLEDMHSNFIETVSVTPDIDGDGLPDIIVGDPLLYPDRRGRVFSFFTGGPGGDIQDPSILNYELMGPASHGGFGNDTAVFGNTAAIACSDEGRVQLLDVATGSTIAQLTGRSGSGFGFSVAPIGDVNGDAVEDWVTSDPNVFPPGSGRGEVYVLSGTITTSGNDWVPIDSLPEGDLIATLRNDDESALFLGVSRQSPFANLGDPNPDNGTDERLLISGAADGFLAHLLTQDSGGEMAVQLVAATNRNSSGITKVRHVEGVGDVDRDGVGDFAVLDDVRPGSKVLVVSGAGLLDGYDQSDVLQQIDPAPPHDHLMAICGLGDYDANGSFDLLVGTLVSGSSADVRYDIYSTAVPEPSSLALLATSVLGLLACRRRRK